MAVINVADDFNTTPVGPLNYTGGSWLTNIIANGGRPAVVTGGDVRQVYSGVDSGGNPLPGYAIWASRSTGAGIIQSSQITLTTLPTIANKGGVIVAAPNDKWISDGVYEPLPAPGTIVNWASGKEFYILRARTSPAQYRIEKKTYQSSATVPFTPTYDVAPVAGDVLRLEYNPTTGELKGYINGTLRITVVDPSPINGNDATGIGFVLDNAGYGDSWSGWWDTGGSQTISKTGSDNNSQIVGIDASSPPVKSNPTQEITDGFNRSNGWLGVAGGTWVASSTVNPQIISQQVTSTGAANAIHTYFNTGTQTAKMVLKSNASTATNRCGIIVGVENISSSTAPTGSAYSWNTLTGPYYRLISRASDYLLQVKIANQDSYNLLATISQAPQVNDEMKIVYNPADGSVQGTVTRGATTYTTGAIAQTPLPANHTRSGIMLTNGNIIDDFSVSYDAEPSFPYKFSLWDGISEEPLRASFWVGGQEIGIDETVTEVIGEPTSSLPQVDVIHSHRVLEQFGMNTAFRREASNVAYGGNNTAWIQQKLIELGVLFLRERVFPGDVNSMGYLTPLVAAGIKCSMNVSQSGTILSGSNLTTVFNWIENNPEKVNNIQGWNEPNDEASVNWATETKTHQQNIYNEFIARGLDQYKHSGPYGEYMYVQGPALMDNPNAAHSISDPSRNIYYVNGAYPELAATGIGQYMHRGNWHRYPLQSLYPTETGDPTYPENNYEREQWASDTYDNKPLEWTEYGFQAAPSVSVGIMDEDAAAVYHVRMILDSVLRGTKRMYAYDFLDLPASTLRGTTPWGLVDATSGTYTSYRIKQSYYTIKDLLATLKDVGTTQYSSKMGLKLTYTDSAINAENGGLRWAVFGKRSGEKYLIMWRLMRIWNRSTSTRRSPSFMTVNVETDSSNQNVQVAGFPVMVKMNSAGTILSVTNLTPTWT